MTHYAAQYNEQLSGSSKGPNSFPEPFQFLQAAVGPIGERGPQVNLRKSSFQLYNFN